MARGRMLNKSICASLKLHDLPDDTCRLMASWIIPHLDLNGVFYADPAMVKSLVFPRRADITIEQIGGYLAAMQQTGLIITFEAKGDLWQWWPGFTDNQVGLRADRESTGYPPPPEIGELELLQSDDGRSPEARRSDGGEMPAEEKLSEENRSEVEEKGADAPPTPEPIPEKPEAKKRKQKPETLPAVKVFREAACRYPPKSWYDDIDQTVGRSPPDLEFWHDVVKGYVGCGWNPTNVKNMLEFFARREIPGSKNGRGDKDATHQPGSGNRQGAIPSSTLTPEQRRACERIDANL